MSVHYRFLRAAALSALLTPAALFAGTKHSLVVAMDGTRADALLMGGNPNVDSLIAGTWASGYNTAWTNKAQTCYDADTWSGPNHGGIMTGVSGGILGIADNSGVKATKFKNYPHYLKRVETASSAKNTAYLVTWSTDYNSIPYGADFGRLSTDASNTGVAAGILAGTYSGTGTNGNVWTAGKIPDAVFVFLDDPDHDGHAYGFDPGVAPYAVGVSIADAQLGQLLAAIKNRPNFANEDWQIIVTSDHGGLATGAHNIGALPTASTIDANQTTIPFLVTSKTVQAGELTGTVRNYDAATTALNHLGVSYPTSGTYPLIGTVQGASVYPVAASRSTDLVANLKFDGGLTDATGRGNNATAMGSNPPTVFASGGKFGGYLRVKGANSYATLGNPTDLQFTAGQDYTISLWFRTSALLTGDASLISNKNWGSGLNTGFIISPGQSGTGTAGLGVGFNAGSGAVRADANAIAFAPNEWVFVAVTVRKDGTATVYSGDSDGVIRSVSTQVSSVGTMISGLPVNIGQDGTAAYGVSFTGDVDDLGIWRRALSSAEVESLFNAGSGDTVLP